MHNLPVSPKTNKEWADYLRRRAKQEPDKEASMAYEIGADAIEQKNHFHYCNFPDDPCYECETEALTKLKEK